MPVHRHLHDKRGSVYALRAELDAWVRSRNLRATPETQETQETGDIPSAPTSPVLSSRPAFWTSSTGRKSVLAVTVVLAALLIVALRWVQKTDYFWRSPIVDARFQTLTDFDETEQAATVSRDGKFVAFLSDRDGPMDVWVTQVGSGQFHNLTHGSASELVNPSVRTLGFSPDSSLVTFWDRKPGGPSGADIEIGRAHV